MKEAFQQFRKRPLTTRISLVVTLGASLLTLVQIILLENGMDGICLSGGCEIVDSQTTVSTVVFNVFGLAFFQALFWGQWAGRRSKELQFYIRMLLLAGLAAEGVLVSFQYLVVETFCSYCLIIFALVLLLNLLHGIQHAVTGIAVFVSAIIAFSTLQFAPPASQAIPTGINDLDKGAYAMLPGQPNKPNLTLFFSSTCPHCENVIESLQGGTPCSVSFNPVSRVTKFPLATATPTEPYDIGVNRAFMKALGQSAIPVLLVEENKHLQLFSGGNAIRKYLDESCRMQSATTKTRQRLPLLDPPEELLLQATDDSCADGDSDQENCGTGE